MSEKDDVTNYISACTEYFRIGKAAELLGCASEDLLHLGVNYKVEIMAPVLAEGIYQWAIDFESSGYPEIVGQVKQYFDAAERVLLSWIDLAKIEAIGWAIPTFFYAPSQAREIDELLQNCLPPSLDEYEPENVITLSKNEGGKQTFSVTYLPMKLLKPNSELIPIRKEYYSAAWYSDEISAVSAEKTTINNLFISKKEFERLKIGGLLEATNKPPRGQTLKNPHGNTVHNAQIEVSVLKAAIYCSRNSPDECKKSNRAWAKLIGEKAALFWLYHEPPRNTDWIERLLGEVIDSDKQLKDNNKLFSEEFWKKKLDLY